MMKRRDPAWNGFDGRQSGAACRKPRGLGTATLLTGAMVCLIFGAASLGQEGPAGNAPKPDEGFVLLAVDGTSLRGNPAMVSEAGVTMAGAENRAIPADEILRLVSGTGRKSPPRHSMSIVMLANGDRLLLRIHEIREDVLSGLWLMAGEDVTLKIPLETIRGLIVSDSDDETFRSRWMRLIERKQEDSDLVLIGGGDQVSGEFLGWTDDAVQMKTAAGEVSIPRTQCRAIRFNASLVSFPKIEGRRQLVSFQDGSQVSVRGLRREGDRISAEALFGASIQCPWSAVDAVRFLGGRVESLSDKVPAAETHTPFISGEWKRRVNRTVDGRPLQLRGQEFPLGLGVHSRSEIRYALEGNYASFFANAGIDDETQGGGNCVFVVEVDGERVFESPAVSGASPPLTIGPIDLAGRKTLSLIVEFGPRGDVQDHADWCDAFLVRSK